MNTYVVELDCSEFGYGPMWLVRADSIEEGYVKMGATPTGTVRYGDMVISVSLHSYPDGDQYPDTIYLVIVGKLIEINSPDQFVGLFRQIYEDHMNQQRSDEEPMKRIS